MKTLEDFKQEQMQDEDFKREYIQFIANSRAIQEIEKLKAEVQGLCHTERDTFDKVVRLDKLNNAIDKHISELKGGNNA